MYLYKSEDLRALVSFVLMSLVMLDLMVFSICAKVVLLLDPRKSVRFMGLSY